MANVAEIKAKLFAATGTSVEERGGNLYTWIDDPSEDGGDEALEAFDETLSEIVDGASVEYTGRSNRNDRDEVSSEVRISLRWAIECRHASGSSHWSIEPDCGDMTHAEAVSALRLLETEDEDGAALEYRLVVAS